MNLKGCTAKYQLIQLQAEFLIIRLQVRQRIHKLSDLSRSIIIAAMVIIIVIRIIIAAVVIVVVI